MTDQLCIPHVCQRALAYEKVLDLDSWTLSCAITHVHDAEKLDGTSFIITVSSARESEATKGFTRKQKACGDGVSIPRAELESLRVKCTRLETCLEQAVPDENKRRYLLTQVTSNSVEASTNNAASQKSRVDAEEEDGGRLLQASDGALRYLGQTSTTVFLESLKEFIAAALPAFIPFSLDASSSISSDPLGGRGTRDLCAPNAQNVDPFWHPSKTDMTLMLARIRYTFQDGCGDFASGGIFYWNDLDVAFFNKKTTEISTDAQSVRELSLFHATFAVATLLNSPPDDRRSSVRRSETFFARSRMLLGNPLNATLRSILDIPILAMMGMYLIEMDRRDTAKMYVSAGIHIAVMFGVHRGWVNDESCKRSFWTLYVLDRWLSVLDGRPPSISDDAIKLSLPVNVSGLPPAVGLKDHVELARIAGYIVCNTFQTSPSEYCTTSNVARTEKALSLLSSWEHRLPAELRVDESLRPAKADKSQAFDVDDATGLLRSSQKSHPATIWRRTTEPK
ncbi:hypothetical protein G7054_g14146 [Neopestalotiopsis clavispora]|nr:hypothetical protein G7054_g14146 [Neopestalotiopsis clavispora]